MPTPLRMNGHANRLRELRRTARLLVAAWAAVVCLSAFGLDVLAAPPDSLPSPPGQAQTPPPGGLEELTRAVEAAQGDFGAAEPDRKRALGNALYQALEKLGDARAGAGNYAGAEAAYQDAMALRVLAAALGREELRQKIDFVARRARLLTDTERLASQLAAQPEDHRLTQRVIRLHVIELDDPGSAVRFLSPQIDEATRTYVPLAAKLPEELAVPVLRELGEWYLRLLADASPEAVPSMLDRARSYLQAFLDRHGQEDAARLKAQTSLKAVEAKIAGMESRRPGEWIDLMKFMDPALDCTAGFAAWMEGRLCARPSDKAPEKRDPVYGTFGFRLPVRPTGSYDAEIAIDFGHGGAEFVFPAGTDLARARLGHLADATSMTVAGHEVPLRPGVAFPDVMKWHELGPQLVQIRVITEDDASPTAVQVAVNGLVYLLWRRSAAPAAEGRRLPRALGQRGILATIRASQGGALHRARIRRVAGKLEPVD